MHSGCVPTTSPQPLLCCCASHAVPAVWAEVWFLADVTAHTQLLKLQDSCAFFHATQPCVDFHHCCRSAYGFDKVDRSLLLGLRLRCGMPIVWQAFAAVHTFYTPLCPCLCQCQLSILLRTDLSLCQDCGLADVLLAVASMGHAMVRTVAWGSTTRQHVLVVVSNQCSKTMALSRADAFCAGTNVSDVSTVPIQPHGLGPSPAASISPAGMRQGVC
jgi:hypothetical protein